MVEYKYVDWLNIVDVTLAMGVAASAAIGNNGRPTRAMAAKRDSLDIWVNSFWATDVRVLLRHLQTISQPKIGSNH